MFFSIFKKFLKTHYTFEGKESAEKTLVVLYRHWFMLFLDVIIFCLLFILPFASYFLVNESLLRLGLNDIFWLLIGIYLIFWWLGIFYRIIMYLMDTWIVTDHRILNNEQHGFFNRTLSEMSIGKIQDVSVRLYGVIPTFLNFGDVEIQTAGTEAKFTFKQIPNPQKIKELVMQVHREFTLQHQGGVEQHENLAL